MFRELTLSSCVFIGMGMHMSLCPCVFPALQEQRVLPLQASSRQMLRREIQATRCDGKQLQISSSKHCDRSVNGRNERRPAGVQLKVFHVGGIADIVPYEGFCMAIGLCMR